MEIDLKAKREALEAEIAQVRKKYSGDQAEKIIARMTALFEALEADVLASLALNPATHPLDPYKAVIAIWLSKVRKRKRVSTLVSNLEKAGFTDIEKKFLASKSLGLWIAANVPPHPKDVVPAPEQAKRTQSRPSTKTSTKKKKPEPENVDPKDRKPEEIMPSPAVIADIARRVSPGFELEIDHPNIDVSRGSKL
jgi:hypothetical protein